MSRILLITVGETPQVVTETLHALHAEGWFPDRIILATTISGETIFNEGRPPRSLADGRVIPGLPCLAGVEGRLSQLCQLLGQRPVAPEIRVARTTAGALIADIGTGDEADAFAQLMFDIAAEATADPASEFRVSLAGGRKTMSAHAAQAFQFFGRASDRLYHVVIRPAALENDPAFWWPGEGGYAATEARPTPPAFASADIRLHPMDVVRMRAFLDSDAIYAEANGRYQQAVRRANEALSVNDMVINLVEKTVSLGQYRSLRPAEQAVAVLALIGYAARTGQQLSVEGSRELRRPALDGDTDKAVHALAWFYQALRARQVWTEREWEASLAVFDAAVARQARTFAYSEFDSPLSRLRALLRTLEPRLANLVLAPRSLKSGFAPGMIRFVLPDELASHPFASNLQ